MRIPRQIPLGLGAPGTEPEALLPVVLTVDDCDSPRDLIDALALTAFVAGHQPYATSKDLVNVRDDATLLPPGARVVRETTTETERARLAVGDGWTLRAVFWPRTKTATVAVTALTAELAAQIVALATDGMTEEPAPEAESVSMGFWYASAHGPARNPRPITAGRWADSGATTHAAPQRGSTSSSRSAATRCAAGSSCCTGRPAPVRPPCCARWPASGGSGASSTAYWIRRRCSAARRT